MSKQRIRKNVLFDMLSGNRSPEIDSLLEKLSYNQRHELLNNKDSRGNSILHYATRLNKDEVCRVLFKHGMNAMAKDNHGRTALHIACKYYFTKKISPVCIKVLLQFGVNPVAYDNLQMTALHYASVRGSAEATKEILSFTRYNNVVDMTDKHGNTALHKSCFAGHIEVVRHLLAAGASLFTRNVFQLTPIHLACTEGRNEIINMLLSSSESGTIGVISNILSVKDCEENTPLHLATESGHLNIVERIMSAVPKEMHKARINIQRANGETALHIAATFGYTDIFKQLIESGSDKNRKNKKMETPLFVAASNGHTDIIKILAKRMADITTTDWQGNTALHTACFNGKLETVEFLLEIFPKKVIHSFNKKEETILMMAVKGQHPAIVKKILEHSGSSLLEMADSNYNTPLHEACKHGYQKCTEILLDYSENINPRNESDRTPLHIAALHGQVEVIKLLLSEADFGSVKGYSYINAEDEVSETPLHMAAANGFADCVSVLLKNGANISNINGELWTPLESAANAGHVNCLKILLNHGVLVNSKSINGENALHLACRNGHENCVKLLLSWTENVSESLPDGRNCLDVCIDNGHEECALVILNHKEWESFMRNATLSTEDDRWTTPMRKLVQKMPKLAKLVFDRCIQPSDCHVDSLDFEFTMDFEFIEDMFELNNWKKLEHNFPTGVINQPYTRDKGKIDEIKTNGYATSIMHDPTKDGDVISIIDNESFVGEEFETTEQTTNSLWPYVNSASELKENHILTIMIKQKQEELVKHPLVTALIHQKWQKYGKYVYAFNLFFYAFYLIAFNYYIAILPPPFVINHTESQKKVDQGLRCFSVIPDASAIWGEGCLLINDSRYTVTYILFIMSGFQLLLEVFQVIALRMKYFTSLGNYLDLFLYISTILILLDTQNFSHSTGIREEWQWQLAVFTILLSWMNLLLYLQNSSFLGIYVLMFINVFKTFFKFSLVVIFFLCAFAMAFYALLENQHNFSTPQLSIAKSFIMMAGEVDYNTVFIEQYSSRDYGSQLHYVAVSYILYICFVLVMTILVMNLLVGLAVGDIQAVQNEAELKRIDIHVGNLLNVQCNAPNKLRQKIIQKQFSIKPNKYRALPKMLRAMFQIKELCPRRVLEIIKGEDYKLKL